MLQESQRRNPAFQEIIAQILRFREMAKDLISLQEFTVTVIAEHLPHYNWVGFYMLDADHPNTLVLGPFHGAPTEHVRIPLNTGICGAAVVHGETIIIEDVASDPRYLACSLETRSEIVVPLRVHGEIAGEIDIDSHTLNAFDLEDQRFLEECASLISAFIETNQGQAIH
jgi:GAF domain-containing protein